MSLFLVVLFCFGSLTAATACLASVGVILAFLTNEFIIFPAFLSAFTSSMYALLIGLSTLFTFKNSAELKFLCSLLLSSFVTAILYPVLSDILYVSLLNLFVPFPKVSFSSNIRTFSPD